MGYVVCHIEKPKGNDAAMTAHIERTIDPKNADRELTCLNQRLVEYSNGVKDRTQAITHRIETAGITRKIGTNQVRALRVMLSGSPEDMHRIVAEGRLDEWCADNVRWLRDTFGVDNVVSADLHRDETTPHIHATVVPIVSGERRKIREQKKREVRPERGENPNSGEDSTSGKSGKRTYRKRPANTVRLCADDVMTRDNLERLQDTYAEAMAKYGLQRGIRGADARHIATTQYYRDLHVKNEGLREDIAELEEQREIRQREVAELAEWELQARTRAEQATTEKQQAEITLADKQSELQKVKGELKAEKFKNSAAEAGTKLMGSVGSLFGSSKIERRQQEIDTLKAENARLTMQLAGKDTQIRNLHRDHQSDIERLRQSHDKVVAAKQKEIDRIARWFPDIPEMAETADYCLDVGFSESQTVALLMRKPVQYTGKLRSPKSGRSYDADGVTARLERRANTLGFTLTINGTPIIQWFKQQFEKLKQAIRPQQNKGVRPH